MNTQPLTRFIDLAHHGGCSKKAPATDLHQLFGKLSIQKLGQPISDIASGFPDVGIFSLDKVSAVSTVDIVLPMVLSASDFGEITVAHVLSDIYAGIAKPSFALAILGVPKGRTSGDDEIVDLMSAAIRKLSSAGVALVGGHTMSEQEDLFLGFAAVGTPLSNRDLSHNRALSVGDALVLTKPLGGSLASLRWKMGGVDETSHRDVLDSMRTLNSAAAEIASAFDIRGCTDITGYGLTGHLRNMLISAGCSATLDTAAIPIFNSVSGLDETEVVQTRQYWHNLDYVSNFLIGSAQLSELQRTCFVDSQVSGGLLLAVADAASTDFVKKCRDSDVDAHVIGRVTRTVDPGTITFV